MLVVGGPSLTEAFDVDHAQRTRGRQPSAELAKVVDPLPLVRYEEEGVAVLRSLADIRLDGPGPDQQAGSRLAGSWGEGRFGTSDERPRRLPLEAWRGETAGSSTVGGRTRVSSPPDSRGSLIAARDGFRAAWQWNTRVAREKRNRFSRHRRRWANKGLPC